MSHKKPTYLRLLEGNPGDRKLPDNEPEYPILEITDAPADLAEEGQRLFVELGKILCAIGALQLVDSTLFHRYCDVYARWYQAKKFIDKNGTTHPVLETVSTFDGKRWAPKLKKDPKTGELVQETRVKRIEMFPQARLYLDLGAQLLRLEQEMGLTPAARSRISIPDGSGRFREKPTEQGDPFAVDDD